MSTFLPILCLFLSFYSSVYSNCVHSKIPLDLQESKRPKTLWISILDLCYSHLKFFLMLFFHFDAVPPNSTQIQPQSFLRVLWKPIMFPTLTARQWPRVVGVYCYDHSTNVPRQRSSADVHSNAGSSLRPSQSSIFSHHWFKAVTGEPPIRSRYSMPH